MGATSTNRVSVSAFTQRAFQHGEELVRVRVLMPGERHLVHRQGDAVVVDVGHGHMLVGGTDPVGEIRQVHGHRGIVWGVHP